MHVNEIDVKGFEAVVWNKVTYTEHSAPHPDDVGKPIDRAILIAAFRGFGEAVDYAVMCNEREPSGGPASYWAEKTTGHEWDSAS